MCARTIWSAISSGFFCWYLWVDMGHFKLVTLDVPMPQNEPGFHEDNTGVHTIFDAWVDDTGLDASLSKRDVVTDGNVVWTRPLASDVEKGLKKRGVGRPRPVRAKVSFRDSDRRRRLRSQAQTPVSRCPAASAETKRLFAQGIPGRIEGVFATVDMNSGESCTCPIC